MAMSDAKTMAEAQEAADKAERDRQRALQNAPSWQRALAESSAWKHYTVDQIPPVTVRFYDNRVEVENCLPSVAKSLYGVLNAVLPSAGYTLSRQGAPNGRGFTAVITDQ